jgi:hypothetical protein
VHVYKSPRPRNGLTVIGTHGLRWMPLVGEATRWVPFPPVPGAEQVTASCTPLRAVMWKPYWSVWTAHQRAVKAVRTVKGDDMVVRKACDWDRSKRVEMETGIGDARAIVEDEEGFAELRMTLEQVGPVRNVQQCLQKDEEERVTCIRSRTNSSSIRRTVARLSQNDNPAHRDLGAGPAGENISPVSGV